MNEVKDPRSFPTYSTANLLCQCLLLFLSQESSRNSLNNRVQHGPFYKENFCRLFKGMSWAHFDTVDDFLRQIKMEDVEKIKTRMVKLLIEKKRLSAFYGFYLIAVDATGITTYDEDPEGKLLHRTSASGKKTYLNIMLEAKIVTPEGLNISIASEPLSNEETSAYKKQDCELKAFTRLSKKLKEMFPRLNICMLMDALYANNTVFNICKKQQWKYIVTLKDGNLLNLQNEITDTEEARRIRFERSVIKNKSKKECGSISYQCIEDLTHKENYFSWIECKYPPEINAKSGEEFPGKRFVYLTNFSLKEMDVSQKAGFIAKIAEAGRLRWKIENEGFNTQKNHGYHLHHKISRSSVETLHVYYIMLQIAHLINQLVIHSKGVVALREKFPKLSIRYLWERLRGFLENRILSLQRLDENLERCQIRLE